MSFITTLGLRIFVMLKTHTILAMRYFKLQDALSNIWALHPESARALLPMLAIALRNGEFGGKMALAGTAEECKEVNLESFNLNANSYVVSSYGQRNPPEQAPMGSIAIIPMMDTITKMDQECGDSGTVTKSNLLSRCDANPNIKATVLHIRSGGGEALAAIEMSRFVQTLNKPIVAFVDDMAASAAYFIGSGCDKVIVNAEYSRVGSIGTYLTIADFTGYFEKLGIKVTDIYATDSTEKNLPYKNALAGDTKDLIKEIDFINNIFQNSVATNRKEALDAAGTDASVWNKGKVFYAEEALKLGLIDGIASLEETINSLL